MEEDGRDLPHGFAATQQPVVGGRGHGLRNRWSDIYHDSDYRENATDSGGRKLDHSSDSGGPQQLIDPRTVLACAVELLDNGLGSTGGCRGDPRAISPRTLVTVRRRPA